MTSFLLDATLAVLCGGRSVRLGTDKGLYAPLEDESLVRHRLRLLAASFAETLVVVRDEEQAELYRTHLADWLERNPRRLRVVIDEERPGNLPNAALTGIETALIHAASERVVICPVDQVGVRALHLRLLLREGARAFVDEAGDIIPFPSVWQKGDRDAISTRIAMGALGVGRAVAELDGRTTAAGDFAGELAFNGNTREELGRYFGSPLYDPFGRRLHYLRFSLTEACNLACTYCLPKGFPEWLRHKTALDRDAIGTILKGFRQLGFRKVRFTGGEPTVHPACKDAVQTARRLGYEEIALTTNGLLIDDLASWERAGLTHLNVSLDSLDPDRFEAVTGSREARKVRDLVERAAARGLNVKVNTVLMRSRNGDRANIEELIDWALELPITLRFIELMDTKLNGAFASDERVLGTEIVPLLLARGLSAKRSDLAAPILKGPATDYGSPDYPGKIGLINPLSCNFCRECNRLRVTARGLLRLCLFGESGKPLELGSPETVARSVREVIDRKPERHYLEEGKVGDVATFRTIGG